MSEHKGINIITFQFPIPANYGGVIEVYEKIKALKDAGYFIILHTFIYDREYDTAIEEIADEVYCYERKKRVIDQLSSTPFIVRSRYSIELLTNILNNNYPILFEGLHTCAYLDDSRLRHRVRWVRAHNIEHEYYNSLALNKDSAIKNLYYKLEARKLKFYEHKLSGANAILAITGKDKTYFENKYASSHTKVIHLPCFAPEPVRNTDIHVLKQVLYHGNLAVEENQQAAIYILDHIAHAIDCPVIIAGANPPDHLKQCIASCDKSVSLIENPSDEELTQLIQSSGINVLLTFQSTGIKLKLINALRLGNQVVVNDLMVAGTSLHSFCEVSELRDIPRLINDLLNTPLLSPSLLAERDNRLNELLSNRKSVSIIDELYKNQYADFTGKISE